MGLSVHRTGIEPEQIPTGGLEFLRGNLTLLTLNAKEQRPGD